MHRIVLVVCVFLALSGCSPCKSGAGLAYVTTNGGKTLAVSRAAAVFAVCRIQRSKAREAVRREKASYHTKGEKNK